MCDCLKDTAQSRLNRNVSVWQGSQYNNLTHMVGSKASSGGLSFFSLFSMRSWRLNALIVVCHFDNDLRQCQRVRFHCICKCFDGQYFFLPSILCVHWASTAAFSCGHLWLVVVINVWWCMLDNQYFGFVGGTFFFYWIKELNVWPCLMIAPPNE